MKLRICEHCGSSIPKKRDVYAYESSGRRLQIRRRKDGSYEQRSIFERFWSMEKKCWMRGKWTAWEPVKEAKA